ncbi:hypothetical protein [Pseudoxanthomonas kaohsiungensis]|uniref:Uncharacterized protein n=1 Tax=Pseudoxanthomonas kaohsiungensis TaxID=283923 RepID=A0ABW3M1G7_9GAMM|nr:hypothetical protein [Pseudoxanthomonas kaohsiungensis]KAF1702873.1 hypothetical protein CSC66_08860 [Pseudoxanthomonas kaohsiungensis]
MADLSVIDHAALAIVARCPDGILPAALGYGLLKSGAVTTERPRIKPQGAALIAARPARRLEQAGLIWFHFAGEYREGFKITLAGQRYLNSLHPQQAA